MPTSAQLGSLLLSESEADAATGYSNPQSGRRELYDPRTSNVCLGFTVMSNKVADDAFRAFDGARSEETIASEATSFYAGGAGEYIRGMIDFVGRCQFQVRPPGSVLGDEMVRFTFGGQAGAPFGDVILFRKGCVVLQVVTVLYTGEHSSVADDLAAAVAKRASTLVTCT